MILGGGSKSFKSFALLHLAFCVANGFRWWKWQTTKGKVLFINCELFPAEVKDRLLKIQFAVGKGDFENIKVVNLRGEFFRIEQIGEWAEQIKKGDYSLVIIDPIYKMLKGRKENAAEDIADLLTHMEILANHSNTAIAACQHFAKGLASAKEAIDRFSGSGVWGRDPDVLLVLTQHKVMFCYTVDTIVRSFSPIDPFTIKFDFPIFQIADDLDPADLKQPKTDKRKEQKYTDEMLALPFWKNGTSELGLLDWHRELQAFKIEISKQQLIRRCQSYGVMQKAFKRQENGLYRCMLEKQEVTQ
jgi:hypothetical protein